MLTSSSRYKVTIVTPGGGRPVLLVPFQPDALVTAFIDELFKRIGRLNLDIKPDTHVATLHLDSETGALLDCEDLLSDVIGEGEREKLFMVLKAETEQHRSESVPGALTVGAAHPNYHVFKYLRVYRHLWESSHALREITFAFES